LSLWYVLGGGLRSLLDKQYQGGIDEPRCISWLIALAFVAGATVRACPHKRKPHELTPMVIHVPDLAGDKLSMPSGTGMRNKALGYRTG